MKANRDCLFLLVEAGMSNSSGNFEERGWTRAEPPKRLLFSKSQFWGVLGKNKVFSDGYRLDSLFLPCVSKFCGIWDRFRLEFG